MKFGFDAIRDQLGGYNYPNSMYGAYNFNGTYTGFGYADFLLGIPQTTQLSIPTPPRYLRGTMWSLYAQDQFKVNQRLTLNYGLRYQLNGPYYDRYGSIANFDPKSGAFVLPEDGITHVNPFYPKNIPIISASQAGFPDRTLVRFPKNSFYPRIGFAYKPFGDDKTVIRAGYGIYGNLIYGSLGRALGGGPFSGSTTYTNAINNGVPLFSFPYPFLPTGASSTQNAFGVNPDSAYAVHSAVESHDRAATGGRRGQVVLCRFPVRQSRIREKHQSTPAKYDSLRSHRRRIRSSIPSAITITAETSIITACRRQLRRTTATPSPSMAATPGRRT